MQLSTPAKTKYFYGFLMIMVCLVWGGGNAIMKLGLESMPPFLMLSMRFIASTLIMLVIFKKKAIETFNRKNFFPCLLVSVFTALTYMMATMAIYLTEATIAGFLMGLAILFTPFLELFIFRKKLDLRIIPVILIVTVGMYLLCGSSGQFVLGIGEICAIVSSVFYGLWLVLSGKYVHDVGPVGLSTMQCATTAVICIPIALIFEDPVSLIETTAIGWWALIYMTVVCTVIVYLVQNLSLKYISPVFVSVILCLEPVFTSVFSFFLLHEVLTFMGYMGGLLIVVGLIIASLIEEGAPETLPDPKK